MVALFDLQFEGELLLLAIDVELDLSGPDINMGVCCAQEWLAQDERRLGVDFHVEYDEVDGNKEIPNFHRDILCYSRGIADCLIRLLQTHGSRGKCMMVKFIVNYLWHDTDACSQVTEGVQKV